MLTAGTRRRRATGMVTVAVVIALAGCDRSTRPDTPPAPATQTSGTAPRTGPPGRSPSGGNGEQAAVEAAYRRFWAVSWRLDAYPEPRWRQVLSTVAADPELTRVLEGTRAQKRTGVTRYGQVTPRPAVVAVTGATARVRDCQGADRSGQADARTGRRVTVGVARNPLNGLLTRGSDGRWRVSDIRYPGGRC